MKKIYTTVLMLVINCMIGFTQPVLNESDFNTSFNLDTYGAEAIDITSGGSGANQTWDYSAVTGLIKTGTTSNVPVSSAPFYTDFPQANYCIKNETTSLFGNYTDYTLINKSTSSFILLGYSDSDTSDPYTDTAILFSFPYTFNTVINETYQYPDDDPVSITSTYDAYGTLKTPFGTYTNVIRQKLVEEGETYYTWFHVNPFYNIMDGFFPDEVNTTGYVSFYTNSSLGLNKSNLEKTITLYPNPANTTINLQTPKNISIDRIQITDLTGKKVFDQTQNSNQINIQNFSNGLYILKVFSGSEVFQSKFIKN